MFKIYGYTLVQHSAYGYGSDPQFRRGVETRQLKTKADLDRVKKLGGVVLDNYTAADTRADEEMYPPGCDTFLTPVAEGTFSDFKIDGLAVYIPKK